MSHRNVAKEVFCLGLTVSRLALAERMARNVREEKSILAPLGLFLLADHFDGAIARRLNADTPLRRSVDAITDRISVARVSLEIAKNSKETRPYFALLAGREAVAALSNTTHYLRTGEVVHGRGLHKLDSLSMAMFGAAPSIGGGEAFVKTAGRLAVAINYATLPDYIMNAVQPHGEMRGSIRHIHFEFLDSHLRGNDNIRE